MIDDFKRQNQHNNSPSKAQGPRSIPNFKDYLKEFPNTLPPQILNYVKKLPLITNTFCVQLETAQLYRPALGQALEQCWVDMLDFIKKFALQTNQSIKKVKEECEQQIESVVRNVADVKKENVQLKDKVERLELLRQIDDGELAIQGAEVEALRRQIQGIYDILQQDVKKIIDYLARVESSQSGDASSAIFTGMERLAQSIKLLQKQKTETSGNLDRMNEFIKAMTRNTKTDSCTQVDESELQTLAKNIFPTNVAKTTQFEEVQKSSLNLDGTAMEAQSGNMHIITQMQMKEKEIPPELYNPKKNVEKPWVLPPTILVFLENMSKENENGRVLPWEHVKKTIYEIYAGRINDIAELAPSFTSGVGTFEDYFVLYFIRKYNIRRLAELKMLEFIISLKYYTKFWPKAEMFAYMLDIMRYTPAFEISDSLNYKFDIYLQHFYFCIYGRMTSGEGLREEEDGSTYINFQKVKVLVRKYLFFTDELSRSRLYAKLEKTQKVLENKKEYVDFDMAIQLFIDEYFAIRKKNIGILSKAFSKTSDTVQGFMSLKQVTNIVMELETVFKDGQTSIGYRYPLSSQLQVCKLYLYSITSGKNNFEVNGKEFLNSCQRFGFDVPFPFLGAGPSHFKEEKTSLVSSPSQDFSLKPGQEIKLFPKGIQQTLETQESPAKQHQGNQFSNVAASSSQRMIQGSSNNNLLAKKVEIGSILFSQHFSILRELRQYCVAFKETLGKEKDLERMWVQFQRILSVLEKGCQFMKFPLKT